MSTCKDVHEFLMRYLDGELSEAELEVFQGHLEICPSCIDYIASYKTTIEAGRNLRDCEEGEMPEALIEAILKARRESS